MLDELKKATENEIHVAVADVLGELGKLAHFTENELKLFATKLADKIKSKL